MRVEISSEVLRSGKERAALLGVFALGLVGRHRVLVDDEGALRRWSEVLPVDLQEEVELVILEAEGAEAIGAANDDEVRVISGPSDWSSVPPALSPTDAFLLLQSPLRAYTENARNDRAFLFAFADEDQRRRLEDAERKGWLVFAGGGIGEVKEAAESRGSRGKALRGWFLCDSDARVRGQLSKNAKLVEKAIRKIERWLRRPEGWSGAILRRRAIENYIPPVRLRTYARDRWSDRWIPEREEFVAQADQCLEQGSGLQAFPDKDDPRRLLVQAMALQHLERLEPEVWHHISLKYGESKSDPTLWSKVSEPARAWLAPGLGEQIAADFFPRARNLHDPTNEIPALIAQLLRRL
jgi:hypothetical protein